VDKILNQLEAFGVTVPGAGEWLARWQAATELAVFGFETPAPDWASMTPADVREHVWRGEVTSTVNRSNHSRLEADRAADEIEAAFWQSVRPHADDLIAQLRPAYEAAAAEARFLADNGITEQDDEKTLFHAPVEVRDAWIRFTTKTWATLDDLLATVTAVYMLLGLRPYWEPSETQWPLQSKRDTWTRTLGVMFTRPGAGGEIPIEGNTPGMSGRPSPRPWERWLKLASILDLPLPSELDPQDVLEGEGVNVKQLARAAAYELAAHTTENPTVQEFTEPELPDDVVDLREIVANTSAPQPKPIGKWQH
jgi:hypothetical protein